MWLTTMCHLGTGLPWDWRTGPTDSSEREHLRQMIAALPAGALVAADAGFVGYETWEAVLRRRPAPAGAGRGQRPAAPGPGLRPRARRAGLPLAGPAGGAAASRRWCCGWWWPTARGTRCTWSPRCWTRRALSDRQVVEIYRLRWGVELFYRHFKQTFGRRKLRSHRGENAEVEATWSLVGLWALGLHGQAELACDAIPASGVSVAGLLRAYRAAMREYRSRPEPGESLWERLGEAVIDGYRRSSKASRDYPRKKREHADRRPGNPPRDGT